MTTEVCVDWSEVAANWTRMSDQVEQMKAAVTERLLADAGPLAGRRVLELGAGTGSLAVRIAELVRPGGSLLASDVADGMVDAIRHTVADRPAVEVTRIDANAIPLDADSFDVVVFRMGLMLLPDPEPALTEIRRVLRADGVFAAAVWGGPQDNPWLTTVGMAAMMHGLVQGGPPVGPGGPFSLADPVDLEKRVRGAGFSDVTVSVIDAVRHFASPDEHFDTVATLSPPLAAAIAAATDVQRAMMRETVAGLTAQYRDADGLHLPLRALVAIARP